MNKWIEMRVVGLPNLKLVHLIYIYFHPIKKNKINKHDEMGIWNFHTHLILFLSKLFLFWIHLSSS